MLISCTKKLADALKIKAFDAVPINRDPLYEWHANLFVYQCREGVLMINNRTRYPVVLYGLVPEHFQMLNKMLLFAIELTFYAEGFSEYVIARYIRRGNEVCFVTKNNRRLLSHMNYIQYHLERRAELQLSTDGVYMVELSKALGQIPMENQSSDKFPVELLWEELREV